MRPPTQWGIGPKACRCDDANQQVRSSSRNLIKSNPDPANLIKFKLSLVQTADKGWYWLFLEALIICEYIWSLMAGDIYKTWKQMAEFYFETKKNLRQFGVIGELQEREQRERGSN